MSRDAIFDTSRRKRSRDEWRDLLEKLRLELADFLRCELAPTDETLDEQDLTSASFQAGLDVLATVNEAADLHFGGVICLTLNYEEAVYVRAFFLPFAGGTRLVTQNQSSDVLTLTYSPEQGWGKLSWQHDSFGEWESYTDMARWSRFTGAPERESR